MVIVIFFKLYLLIFIYLYNYTLTWSKDSKFEVDWHTALALLDDMMTMGVPYNIHGNWGSAGLYMSDMGPCSGLSCCRSWNGVYCSKPTGPSSSRPLDRVQHSKAPPFSTALLLIGHLCRHGDNSCLWDEEATFGVPASLTACNWRIPKSLMAFKTHACRGELGL